MRIKLIKADGTEIDSRQIRITREFIAPLADVDTTSNTSTPLTFNLSAEDKERLEKLQSLIKNAPAEEQ